jgi:hypothetical protein
MNWIKMEILNSIKENFYPDPYPILESDICDSLLHLSRNSIGGCKYLLLVNKISSESNLKDLVNSQKKLLKKYYTAHVMKGIGVVDIFIGNESNWSNTIKPDWHGLQTVILQGILFIDTDKKIFKLVQSQWGPIKFGNFQGQIDKVYYLLGKLGFSKKK